MPRRPRRPPLTSRQLPSELPTPHTSPHAGPSVSTKATYLKPACSASTVHSPRHSSKRAVNSRIPMASPAAVKKVLFPITEGSEPVEAFVPIAVLRRAGADVTVAAAGAGAGAGADDLRVHAMYGVTVVADASVADCADASYHLVALPGGVPGADNLGGCAALESIVRRQALGGGNYAAICAAPPLALARWGLLNGVKATAHPWFVDKFPAEVAAVDANVVVDGRIVTGRGPAPAMEFALALVEQLYGKDKVDEIAKPMMVRYEPEYAFKELNPVQWPCSGTPKVLIPVANGSDDIEVIVAIDVLRRAKADVVVASAEGGAGAEVVVALHGTRIVADALLDDAVAAAGQQFDLIVVPGGMPGAKTLAGTEALVALLKEQAAAGRAYGAIGADATAEVLEPHGLLEGKKATTTCGECGSSSRVVVDGNVATSRGAGTAMEFALAVVEKLLGAEAAREVAEALLFV